MSTEDLAQACGIGRRTLYRIESGEPITDLGRLIRWAQVLRIPEALLWFKLPGQRREAERPSGTGSRRPPSLRNARPSGGCVAAPPAASAHRSRT